MRRSHRVYPNDGAGGIALVRKDSLSKVTIKACPAHSTLERARAGSRAPSVARILVLLLLAPITFPCRLFGTLCLSGTLCAQARRGDDCVPTTRLACRLATYDYTGNAVSPIIARHLRRRMWRCTRCKSQIRRRSLRCSTKLTSASTTFASQVTVRMSGSGAGLAVPGGRAAFKAVVRHRVDHCNTRGIL